VDDVNNMDESVNTVEQPAGRVERALSTGLDRRTMLKAAVATGTIAATWVAPRVETLGFTPAAAAGTPCPVTDNGSVTINANNASNAFCPAPGPALCCGQAAGNQGQAEQWFFGMPNATPAVPVIPGCDSITVRSISSNCTADNNPDIGQMALAITAISPSDANSTCRDCTIHSITYVGGNTSTNPPTDVTILATAINCGGFPLGAANVSVPSCTRIVNGNAVPFIRSGSRVRVTLRCTVESGGCTPTP
jgi:hypothetical protein